MDSTTDDVNARIDAWYRQEAERIVAAYPRPIDLVHVDREALAIAMTAVERWPDELGPRPSASTVYVGVSMDAFAMLIQAMEREAAAG